MTLRACFCEVDQDCYPVSAWCDSCQATAYRVDVTDGSPAGAPTWAANALRFSSEAEAHAYALDLGARWMAAVAARVVVDQQTAQRELVDPSDPRIILF